MGKNSVNINGVCRSLGAFSYPRIKKSSGYHEYISRKPWILWLLNTYLFSAYWAHVKSLKVWELDFTYLRTSRNKSAKLNISFTIPGLGSSESFIKVKADKKWGCENDNIEFAPSNSFSFGQGNVVSQDQSSVFAANSILLCQTL